MEAFEKEFGATVRDEPLPLLGKAHSRFCRLLVVELESVLWNCNTDDLFIPEKVQFQSFLPKREMKERGLSSTRAEGGALGGERRIKTPGRGIWKSRGSSATPQCSVSPAGPPRPQTRPRGCARPLCEDISNHFPLEEAASSPLQFGVGAHAGSLWDVGCVCARTCVHVYVCVHV